MHQNHAPPRGKRSTQDSTQSWEREWKAWDWNEIYMTWDQVPFGVPEDHAAIGSPWIKTERGIGSIPFSGSITNALYIARWINLLWYNQQRFIKYTIKGMTLVREQTSSRYPL